MLEIVISCIGIVVTIADICVGLYAIYLALKKK